MMKRLLQIGSVLVTYLAAAPAAHATFSTPVEVPEPESIGLFGAGGVAILVARYLARRRRKDHRKE